MNAKSKKDAFTTPRVDDIIDKMHGAKVFSKIDVKSAYHNIMIAPEDRHKLHLDLMENCMNTIESLLD